MGFKNRVVSNLGAGLGRQPQLYSLRGIKRGGPLDMTASFSAWIVKLTFYDPFSSFVKLSLPC
jgi:hypothetical protein